MTSSFVLFVWTAIMTVNGDVKYDWRARAEFHGKNAEQAKFLCENAAKELEIPNILYACVKTK